MMDQIFNTVPYFGLGLGIVAVFCLLEMVLRELTNRYAAPPTQR